MCASATVGAQERPWSRPGIVRDSSGAAIANVEIRHVRGDSILVISRASDSGQFVLGGILRDDRVIARRLGYTLIEVPLRPLDRDTLRLVLAAIPTTLSEFEVFAAGGLSGKLREFYLRRERNSFGQYFTRDEIRAAGKRVPSELLRLSPGVTLSPSRRFGYVVRFRGCRAAPLIWIDGTRLPGAELDETANIEDIAAMELYPSLAGVPGQYQDVTNMGCGTILLWTRVR